MNKSEIGKVVYPEWIETAKLSLNKKNYLIFRDILDDVIVYGEIPNTYDKNSKAYKLFKALKIEPNMQSKVRKYEQKRSKSEHKMESNWNENNSQNTDKQECDLGKYGNRKYRNKEIRNKETEEEIASNADVAAMDDIFAEVDKLF